MFKTGVIHKIMVDLGITQHLIANCNLIFNYYNDYWKYQKQLGEVYSFYGKNILLLPFDNSFLELSNI